jgi:hypothetical protein
MNNTPPLEQLEEAFAGFVITTMPIGTHADYQRIAIQKTLVVSIGEPAYYTGIEFRQMLWH